MNVVFSVTVTTAWLSPPSVRIFSVTSLPLLAATTPVTPRFVQSMRSASFFFAMSVADITTMRRRLLVPGSGVASTRSPSATSVTLIDSAFFKSVTPGATFCAIVSAVTFNATAAPLSGLISISAVSALKRLTVPTTLLAGVCAGAIELQR